MPMPSRRMLAIVAVALAGAVLIVAAARLAERRASPTGQGAAQVLPSHGATPPATPPSDQPTSFAAAPTPSDTPSPTPSPTQHATPTPAPSMTPVTILTQRLRTRPGGSVTLQAATAPRTACSISVGYSPAPKLGPMTSSDQGAVTWQWTVSASVQPGIYEILVTCGSGSRGTTITVV
jgi:hypothetical protein